MIFTIYFHNKPLFLTDSITKELEGYLHQSDTMFIDEFNVHTVGTMIHEMEQPQVERGVFLHGNVTELLQAFKKKLHLIQAAGGLVHANGNFLLIFRLGKWDLPKGKLDAGEDLETCALREVEEETGLKGARIGHPLPVTYHTYHQNGKFILKESHWFFMEAKLQKDLVPQTEEDIEKCQWVPVEELEPYLSHTHRSVADVLHAALERIKTS